MFSILWLQIMLVMTICTGALMRDNIMPQVLTFRYVVSVVQSFMSIQNITLALMI